MKHMLDATVGDTDETNELNELNEPSHKRTRVSAYKLEAIVNTQSLLTTFANFENMKVTVHVKQDHICFVHNSESFVLSSKLKYINSNYTEDFSFDFAIHSIYSSAL